MAKRGAAVLEMPEPEYAPGNGSRARPFGRATSTRRDPVEDFADEYEAEPERGSRGPRAAVKLKVGGRLPLPQTKAGLIATGVALLLLLGAVFWLLAVTRSFLLHDERFQIAGASAIEIEGNHHLKRAQLLGLFAGDMERNIFRVSLEQRQAGLESLPWVKRATVMRLLPGRLRVSVVERTPVAFVRQGGRIGLVDANGVLLDMAAGAQAEHYSFPVVTGIAASDPASTRAARMKIFERFTGELDAGGAKNTESLSEVDLSNPEDVKALVDEHGTTVLVHFGEDQFLERYRKVKELLPQWHAQYPNLASADMRYEHEIPLAMAAPVKVAAAAHGNAPKAVAAVVHPAAVAPKVPVVAAKSAVHAAVAHPTATHTGDKAFVPAPGVKPWQPSTAPSASAVSTTASVSAAARSGFAAKTAPNSAPKLASAVQPKASSGNAPKAPARVPPKPQVTAARSVERPASLSMAAKHPGGKPSAGKPLLPADTNPSPQVAPQ